MWLLPAAADERDASLVGVVERGQDRRRMNACSAISASVDGSAM